MFRRNKSKAGGKSDDMIALTSPDVLSSSSADPPPVGRKSSNSRGGLLFGKGGRLKKKKSISNTTSDNTTTNNNKLTSSNDTKETSNTDPSAQSVTKIDDLVRQRQSEMGAQVQYNTTINNIIPAAATEQQSLQQPPPLLKTSPSKKAMKKSKKKGKNKKSQQKQQQEIDNIIQQRTPQPPPSLMDSNNTSGMSQGSRGTMPPPLTTPPTKQQQKSSTQLQHSNIRTNSAGGGHVNNNNNTTGGSMTRSGWSMSSSNNNDTISMNSENYIQSLDNLPAVATNTLRSGKAFPTLTSQQPQDNNNTNHRMSSLQQHQQQPNHHKIRMALSRQFGRTFPPQTYHQKWNVTVSKSKWDGEENRHKYKINITRCQNNKDDTSAQSAASSYSTFASRSGLQTANTKRSIQDFIWLEQALRNEYNGALVVPLLSLSLYFGKSFDVVNYNIIGGGGGGGGGEELNDEELASKKSFATEQTDTTSKGVELDLFDRQGENTTTILSQSYTLLNEKILQENESVDETILENWLSDIINGMRGNGEVLLYNCVDVVEESEAMETFLYRHSESRANDNNDGFWAQMGGGGNNNRNNNRQYTSSLGSPFNLFTVKEEGYGAAQNNNNNNNHHKGFLENLMENPFECFSMATTQCVGDDTKKRSRAAVAHDSRRRPGMQQFSSMMCSSGATGVPGINNCNSYLSQQQRGRGGMSSGVIHEEGGSSLDWLQASSHHGNATHSELLEAEKDLVASYLKSTTHAMTRIQSLTKNEAYVGQCWKRFATSLSNLFSVEKDLEQAHIGDQIKSNKKHQPFRKLRKSSVDDALRILARGKVERSNPSLRTLTCMLNAYYADLNSIVPAFREYSEAMNQLHQRDDMNSVNNNNRGRRNNNGAGGRSLQSGNNEWQSSLKAMTWGVFTGGGTVGTNESEPTNADYYDDLSTIGSLSTAQTKALHTRVLQNEKMLKFSITLLCKASPLRNARMAWWYLKTEAKQALNVHTAATSLRQKLSIDADAAIAMKERGYDEDEKRDDAAEIELVKRILDLGSSDNMENEEASRQNALRIATEQVGRWNAKCALALMEAAGVEDAEVQIDETSRELRHVRKYAISLRENVARCLESAETLSSSFFVNSENSVQISRSRREFWAAISAVFSGKIISDEFDSNNGSTIGTPSTRVLASAGIDVTDRGGWLGRNATTNQPNQLRRNCGETARQYLKKRDNQTNTLIARMIKLLKDYERRLEGIESFVYMHCVGIQLEKHCSKARSKALSAWEKRTDISTAINVATKKKIPKLVQELKVKLDALPQVSHTTVIKRKEQHLASKTLKSDLHKLANRRFGRAQEVSTERVIAVMSLWAKHEESVAMEEVKALGEAVQEVELSIGSTDVDAALDSRSLIHRNQSF